MASGHHPEQHPLFETKRQATRHCACIPGTSLSLIFVCTLRTLKTRFITGDDEVRTVHHAQAVYPGYTNLNPRATGSRFDGVGHQCLPPDFGPSRVPDRGWLDARHKAIGLEVLDSWGCTTAHPSLLLVFHASRD